MKLTMAGRGVLFLLCVLSAGCAFGQTHKITWDACSAQIKPWEAAVKKFNDEHAAKKDGLSILLDCQYSNPSPQKPKQKVPLTTEEINILHSLRDQSDKAFKALDAYEDLLISSHHVKKPSTSDPCYYFVGIVVDTDYITIDPNAPFGDCK